MTRAAVPGKIGTTPVSTGRLNRRVAITLRLGVATAAVLMLGGLALHVVQGGGDLLDRSAGLSAGAVRDALVPPTALGLVLLGVILLAATPLLRVVLSLEWFASIGDREFTALTLFVLALLLSSVAVGVLA